MQARKVEILNLQFVKIGPRHRELREEQVSSLMQSISKIGLKTPITVRQPLGDDDVYLVAGGHRLEACRRLGLEEIEAFVVESDDEDAARMWEIAENLHRAELTKLERDEHIAEWIALSNSKSAADSSEEIGGQDDGNHIGEKLRKISAVATGGRGNEGGIRQAAREFSIDEKAAREAVKVASLSEEAKEAAKEIGLDDNRSALLEAAKVDRDRQAEKLREIARVKEFRKRFREEQSNDPSQRQINALHKAWDAADSDARARFLENIGVTSFVGIEL